MCWTALLYAKKKKKGFDHYERMKKTVTDGGKAAYTNPTDHLAYNIKIFEEDLAETAAEHATAAVELQREQSHRGGSPFRASAGVSRGSDLATPDQKIQNSQESKRSATSPGHLTTSLDGNQPTIFDFDFELYQSIIKQAEPGHSGSSSLSATAKVFLSNAAKQAHIEP
jgi:hypothetical protein